MQRIEKRRLGKTDINITPIGLGAMQFSGSGGMMGRILAGLSPETTNAVIKAALDSGISWIDTAEIYGSGTSEKRVSMGLTAANIAAGDVMIATKWFPVFKRAHSLKKAAEKSTRYLEPYPIDLYQVHAPYSISSYKTQMDRMADLVEAKVIRAVGVSNFSADQMVSAHEALAERGIPLASNQVRVNLLNRGIITNGILDTAIELGMTIIAYSPLGQGLLTGKFHHNQDLLKTTPRFRRWMLRRNLKKTQSLVEGVSAIALRHDATPAQVALSWVINLHDDTVVAIPGASQPVHAEQNAGAMQLKLSQEERGALNDFI